jgi:transcriptional regulator with XRE-family HTH domain
MSEIKKHLGAQVRRLREAMGISARELSKRCGISSPSMFYIEMGESWPKPETLEALSRELGVSLSVLLDNKTPETFALAEWLEALPIAARRGIAAMVAAIPGAPAAPKALTEGRATPSPQGSESPSTTAERVDSLAEVPQDQ